MSDLDPAAPTAARDATAGAPVVPAGGLAEVLARDDPRRARRATGLLGTFNAAGVLIAADVHVARRLGALVDETRETVLLACALAVRAPRVGHVFSDLRTVAGTTIVESEQTVDLSTLPWPDPDAWLPEVADSPLCARGEDAPERRPLRLVGDRLYLDRYWAEERQVAEDLRALDVDAAGVDPAVLADGVARLFAPATRAAGSARETRDPTGGATPPDDVAPGAEPPAATAIERDDLQARAAATAVRRRLAVVAGGPGTGKTTTVGRLVALLLEQAEARGDQPPLIALAAPTGKAAARLQEALREAAAHLDVDPAVRTRIAELSASTVHRLLGWRPGSQSRFRHHRANRLPHDVVIVDESSMVSLSLMARLAEAVRPDARLVLVGDPGQLTSVEAGAVLGDVVASGLTGTVELQRVHRYGGRIGRLADAIRRGDGDATIAALREDGDEVRWLPVDVEVAAPAALAEVRDAAVAAGGAVLGRARAGDGAGALRALGGFRLLCAHRRGPHGQRAWRGRVERWLREGLASFDPTGEWYVGRPLLVTENDEALRLYNGDTGIVVAGADGGVAAAFERGGGVVTLGPGRLGAVETVHAMTIHKSQGSQFATVAVVVPPASSPILTRELLYTAVTRASERVLVVGPEDAVRAAVARPAARASALRERLTADG
ncbi:exodeoxyribonuclease V subunit alpha [Patulibacter brassicae]|uniref:RecBCD enzyme subunit RecD n=1 Tax=Patulibacter brassicae TaxID=1705717 RepID=A0ABU4VLU1_9ACTN|nr:exodeoxyribonuclease V subunit alpha [Patulibacter brassicae]MDX8152059.1 exodeoxyribonuclease V subunit alpha [Patulibacter brassicae]